VRVVKHSDSLNMRWNTNLGISEILDLLNAPHPRPFSRLREKGDFLHQIRIGMTTYLKSPFSGIVIKADELESPKATLI
jgi:hypothetical protein